MHFWSYYQFSVLSCISSTSWCILTLLFVELAFGVNNKVLDNFISFPESLESHSFVTRTLGMIKTSDYGAAVQNQCLYLKLFASPCFASCVAKCGSCLWWCWVNIPKTLWNLCHAWCCLPCYPSMIGCGMFN